MTTDTALQQAIQLFCINFVILFYFTYSAVRIVPNNHPYEALFQKMPDLIKENQMTFLLGNAKVKLRLESTTMRNFQHTGFLESLNLEMEKDLLDHPVHLLANAREFSQR